MNHLGEATMGAEGEAALNKEDEEQALLTK